MARENLELIRGAYDLPFGGEEWVALVEEFATADFEDRTLPETAVGLRGPQAIIAVAARMNEAFEDVPTP